MYGREFHTIKCECNECFLSSSAQNSFLLLIQSSLPAQSVSILSHTHPRLCHSHLCFHLVWLHGSSFIPFACVDCHHFVLLHLKTFFNESITASGPSSLTQRTARHILSAVTSDRKGKPICTHIFLAVLQLLVETSAHVSSSRVFWVQDQFSLPKKKTQKTCSTILLHLILHSTSLLL